MVNVKEVLRGKVSLDIECVDHVLLNGFVRHLQMPGSVVRFIREQKNCPVPSPLILRKATEEFRAAVERFAAERGLEIVTFAKGENKEAIAHAHLAAFPGTRGVVLIGKAQEVVKSFAGHHAKRAGKVWFTYSPTKVLVTQYYFYLLDEEFGLAFIKVSTYLPFEVKVCFNGHEWAKRHLRQAGIAFEALDNGFLSCADAGRLQTMALQLSAEKIQAFFDRWVEQLPWPLSAAERAAGYQHELSIWQLEVSRTQVFSDAEQGRALVEHLIRENLDLGRPDRVSLIFERKVTQATPGAFQTQVIQHGVLPSIRIYYKHSTLKQYLKDGRALRTEMMINNPKDFYHQQSLKHFATLVALGRRCNDRLLEQEELSQDCFVPLDEVRRLGRSTVDDDGRRASALRFGDQRVMAVLSALTNFVLVPAGLSNKTLRSRVAGLMEVPSVTYSPAQMSYDLRRLRLKGLIVRVPRSHTYALTQVGAKVAIFFTKLYAHCFRPGLAAITPGQASASELAQALTTVSELIRSVLADDFPAAQPAL